MEKVAVRNNQLDARKRGIVKVTFFKKPSKFRTMFAIFAATLVIYALQSIWNSTGRIKISNAGPLPISLEQAPRLFDQCSRGAPEPDGKIWLPSEIEIAKMEDNLRKYLSRGKSLMKWIKSKDAVTYRGQFVGFMKADEAFIYASYLSQRDLHYFKSSFEKQRAILLCDGAPASWGIVYNVESEEFSQFSVNGI